MSMQKLTKKLRDSNQRWRIWTAVVALVTLALNGIILLYLIKLEQIGCKCAYDWRRNYIIGYTAFYIIYCAIEIFIMASNSLESSLANQFKALRPYVLVANLLFAVFGIQYVHRLKREKCACSEQFGQQALYIVAVIDAFFITLIILNLIVTWMYK